MSGWRSTKTAAREAVSRRARGALGARTFAGATVIAVAFLAVSPVVHGQAPSPRGVKVFIVTMFDVEAQPWIEALGLTQTLAVAGLPAGDPVVRCNADDVCLVTTGMGKANAAASVAAVVFSGTFDLRQTYFLVAGVAGIDPGQGTLGSVAFATNVVDYGISWEVDARTLPAGWTTGYLGIDATSPTQKPPGLFGTELYTLTPALVSKAVALAGGATLGDDSTALACRAGYTSAPASASPAVVACDTTTSDTYWQGALLGQRATQWVSLLTGGAGTYCTSQQEDNAAITALQRGASAGLLDATRVVVANGASSFDRPPAGQSPYDALVACGHAGLEPAIGNLVAAAGPLVSAIVADWSDWQNGVPQ
jgi:purine nucleoside permease